MRDAIIAGLTTAIFEDNLNLVNEDHDIDNGINITANRILEALAAAGHDTAYAAPIVLPVATPVIPVSLTDVIAAAAADALNTPDDDDQPFGACILDGHPGEDEDDCTTHNHENTDTTAAADPYANHSVYQIPAGPDLRQVRNMVQAIAPLFGAVVYYRYDQATGERVMDVASPTAVKDVFTHTITGLTIAVRQHITDHHVYPRAAATLYATLGEMLAVDLIANPTFQSLVQHRIGRGTDLSTSRTMLRENTGAPARNLTYAPVADEDSEIADTARILLIENAPTL